MRLFLLIFLSILTSCASRSNLDYSPSEYQRMIRVGAIEKVEPYFTCFKDHQLQKDAVYYNFYNMTVEQVYAYAEYIDEGFSVENGAYRYDTLIKNNNSTHIKTRVAGQANLYDKQIALCTNAALVRNINNRKHVDYSSRFNVYEGYFNITLKIVPNSIIERFLKDKISYNKIIQELNNINEKHKANDKIELFCVDDKCVWRKQKDYISSYNVNIVKHYTRNYTGGFKYNINYGYVADMLERIGTDNKLKSLYKL